MKLMTTKHSKVDLLIIDGLCLRTQTYESYFGGKRKGKRGRGSAGKVPVFGILKHGGKVYALDY